MGVRQMVMGDWVGEIRRLCGPAVDRGEMGRFLAQTRIEPASLDRYVRFEPGRYTRHLVHRDRDVELLVLCWARGARAPIHGHEGELCWARVERGRLRFTGYRERSRAPLWLEATAPPLDAGPGHVDGPADIHEVENPTAFAADAVTLHVYSRPYEECDIYDVAQGTVRRARLQYDSVPPDLAGVSG